MSQINTRNNSNDYSFLHSNWKQLCGLSWATFILYEIIVELDHRFNLNPICPHSPIDYSLWYWLVCSAATGGFIQLWLLLLYKIHQAWSEGDQVPYWIAFHVVTIGIISTLLAFFNWGGLCTDALGVSSSAAIWGEWFANGPMLVLLTLTIVDKFNLSQTDYMLIVTLFISLVAGFCVILLQTRSEGLVSLTISSLCYFPILYLPTWCNQHAKGMGCDIITMQKNAHLYAKQRDLSLLLAIGFSLFPVNYFAGFMNILGSAETIAGFQILNVVIKSLFAFLCMDIHQPSFNDAHKLVDEERKSNDSKRNFMKYIFHEVRSPLNSITMGIELCEGDNNMTINSRDALTMMRSATTFMSDTLNKVLNMQKIEEGKFELELTTFDINETVTKMLHTFAGAATAKKIRVVKRVAINIPKFLIGDCYRIEHVIGNYLSNAIKFSPTNKSIVVHVNCEEILELRTSKSKDGKRKTLLTVSVIDEGLGISKENQDKLFQDFVQINPGKSQKGEGSGLGLALCKQIVTLHGGTVNVQSVERQGSTFSFSIPLEMPPEEEMTKQRVAAGNDSCISSTNAVGIMLTRTTNSRRSSRLSEVSSSASSDDSATLSTKSMNSSGAYTYGIEINTLIVDDVLSNRKMLHMLLMKKGVKSNLVKNGQEALEAVASDIDEYKIIFMDNMMPLMNGVEATRRIRKLGYKYLIVGVTGSVMDDEAHEFITAGADMILTKPFDISRLQQLLIFTETNGIESKYSSGMFLANDSLGEFYWIKK